MTEPAFTDEDENFFLTVPELKLLESSLEQKIEALSACFGVMPLGVATKALAQHRNELLPLHAKIVALRVALAMGAESA